MGLLRASGVDTPTMPEAIILVGEADLPALLTSGYVTDYAIASPTEIGLDPDSFLAVGSPGWVTTEFGWRSAPMAWQR